MKAFTLIELIFVIVIIGLLSITLINNIPDNTMTNSVNFVYNKIIEKKSNAIGFMADMNNADENRSVCITFDKEWLKNDEQKEHVKFSPSCRIDVSSNINTICFDYMGRPYKNSVDLDNFNNLLHDEVDVNISYKNEYKIIKIYPISGNVEISCNGS